MNAPNDENEDQCGNDHGERRTRQITVHCDGMRIVKEDSVKVLPDVTAWLALNDWCASSRELVLSIAAHHAAVPVVTMVPSVMAVEATKRPLTECVDGEPNAPPAANALLPSELAAPIEHSE